MSNEEKHAFVEHDKYFNWLIGKNFQFSISNFSIFIHQGVSFFSTMIVSDKNAQ